MDEKSIRGEREMIYNQIIHIWLILNFITTVFMVYQLSITLGAFKRKKAAAPENIKHHRFAALIAARNEEVVIGTLIRSIQAQNYPEGMIDVIVIADNCDDKTAEIARKAGAIVYERFNKTLIGKGYVIKFVLEKIFAERDIYDAFCVFDADNVVDKNFFMQMNRTLNDGADIAQGYRDMKNPTDNWISGCHSLFYWMENRFFDYARAELGLSAMINGTGFMMSTHYLKQYGYDMKTVTEDVELTVQSVINGKKVEWVPEARVYDEQPITFKQSMIQRSRWVSGFIQNSSKYFKDFFKSIRERATWVKIDLFMFLISLPIMILGILSIIIYSALALFNIFDLTSTLISLIALLVGTLAVFWVIGFLSVLLEGKSMRGMAKAILMNPIFNLTWALIWCKCVFVHTNEWTPIVHDRNISIEEIEGSHQK